MLTLCVNSVEKSLVDKGSFGFRVEVYQCINIFRKIWFSLLCRLDNLREVRGKYEKHKCGPVAGEVIIIILF